MEIAIEKGLNAKVTKMGAGEKEKAYAVGQSTLKSFILGIVFALIVLGGLAGGYIMLYQNEKVKSIVMKRDSAIKTSKNAQKSLRVGMDMIKKIGGEFNDQLNSERILKRINAVVENRFTELVTQNSQGGKIYIYILYFYINISLNK